MITRRFAARLLGSVLFASALPAAALAAGVRVNDAETTYAAGVYSLHWSVSAPATPVDVYVAPSPSGARGALRQVVAGVTTGAAKINDPLGKGVRPYFYLQPRATGGRGLWTATRVVPLEGASNFRDLGGYETANGRRVVWGELFRSNGLSNLTPADYETLDRLGVRVVCDLRTEQERQAQPTAWRGVAPTFFNSPKAKLDFDIKALGAAPDAAKVRRLLLTMYRRMIDSYAEEYRLLFKELLSGDVPLIVHCSAGKDRTGIGSALILTALGAPRDTVVADYVLSGPLLGDRQVRHEAGAGRADPTATMLAGFSPQARDMLLASDPAYIEAALDQAAAEYESLNGYLQNRLGVGPAELQALRARYTR